jgi:hypothetical protein
MDTMDFIQRGPPAEFCALMDVLENANQGYGYYTYRKDSISVPPSAAMQLEIPENLVALKSRPKGNINPYLLGMASKYLIDDNISSIDLDQDISSLAESLKSQFEKQNDPNSVNDSVGALDKWEISDEVVQYEEDLDESPGPNPKDHSEGISLDDFEILLEDDISFIPQDVDENYAPQSPEGDEDEIEWVV